MNNQKFQQKTALIIGGSSGMGKATAKLLLSYGAPVIIASKSQASVDAAVRELNGSGSVVGRRVNLAIASEVETFIKELEGLGTIDYLVNTSGFFAPKPFLESAPADYDAFLDINRGAKAGLQAFTQQVGMELAADHIRVNAIAPGVVETGVLDELAGSPEGAKEVYKTLNALHPLGRNGRPEEIAATVAFLLSDDAAWVTGTIWDVDGGMGAGRS